MPFEIAIEGPSEDVSRLMAGLESFSPVFEAIPPRRHGDPERGRVVVVESHEEHLDTAIKEISRVVEMTEIAVSPPVELQMRVRNLAYSEPGSGSSQFARPFRPVPSLTIHPWTAGLEPPEDPLAVILDPHHAFGTGKHPTTILCLKIMDLLSRENSSAGGLRGARVLDFGCGTGLLAMAAVKMGAREVVGVEIDPSSVRAARANVALNNLTDRVEIREGSWETVHEEYDVVFANLVISTLLRTGIHIPDRLTRAGLAVVSGFGENQVQDVRGLLERGGLTLKEEYFLEGWGAALLSR